MANFACVPRGVTDQSLRRVSTTPARLRMLSVSNTDHKILAAAMSVPLGIVAQATVLAQQRGGIAGRALGDAILHVETHALLCTRIADAFPGIVFV